MKVAPASAKPCFLQSFENVLAGLLRAELSSEDLGIKKRGKMQDNDALALGILVPTHLGIGGRKKWMRLQLDGTGRAAREGAITALDRLGVAAKEKIRKA